MQMKEEPEEVDYITIYCQRKAQTLKHSERTWN